MKQLQHLSSTTALKIFSTVHNQSSLLLFTCMQIYKKVQDVILRRQCFCCHQLKFIKQGFTECLLQPRHCTSEKALFKKVWILQYWNCLNLSAISEKAMAPHSSTLAWEIPWTEEPGGLVHGVAKSRTRLSDFTFMHWRRKWQPTPVFLPGESQGHCLSTYTDSYWLITFIEFLSNAWW